jgi:hypothetical protein
LIYLKFVLRNANDNAEEAGEPQDEMDLDQVQEDPELEDRSDEVEDEEDAEEQETGIRSPLLLFLS